MSSQPKSYLKLGLVVLFLILLVLLSSLILPRKAPQLQTPNLIKALNFSSTFEFVFRSEGLSKIVVDNLQGKEGEYVVYIEELPVTTHLGGENQKDSQRHLPGEKDVELYTLRASDSFPAASLYKVYLMAAVLKEVEESTPVIPSPKGEGSLANASKDESETSSEILRFAQNDNRKDSGQARMTMETKLTASKTHLTEVFGGVDFGYEDRDEIIEYTVEEALIRVGRISDNFAAIMLMDKVGHDKVQAMADSLGATSTNIKSPVTTSAQDMGEFFKKLYKREIVSPFVSEKLIEFLSLNQLNDRIPAGLPEGTKVIHKTGELSGVRHDAGIVYLEGHPYVIVLMSHNLKYEDEGVETLAKISRDVFEYFKLKSLK